MSLFRPSVDGGRDAAGWEALRSFATGGGPLLGASAKAALTLIPVYSATSLIADQLSVLPLAGYDLVGGRRTKLDPQPELCTNPHPNPVFTRIEWLHQFATSYLLRGNSYGLVTATDRAGNPRRVQWLNPDNVRVDESGPVPRYFWHDQLQDLATIVHIPWYPQPGCVVGLSPIGQFRAEFETGAAAANYGRNWFRNGATPSGHLKYGAGVLNNEQSDFAKTRFKAAVAGNDFFVSGNDWDWSPLSVAADDAQFLQTIKATANQIAAIYHVDPEDIGGEPGSSLTYATLEGNQMKFQVRALMPIFTRLEHHMNRLMPGTQYVKFNADAIVRTDLKSRMEAHEIALRSAMETQDEGRALEDKAPLTDAEQQDWLKHYGKQTPPPPKEARDYA